MKITRVDPILPLDLLIEILLRLPVKTLMRFTCVSKSWKSLITDDPLFVKLHLKRSPKNMHILLSLEDENRDSEKEDTSIIPCSVSCLLEDPPPMIDDERCYRMKDKYLVVGSCNGLVCLGRFYNLGLIEEFQVRIWNPATHLRSKKSPTLRMNAPQGKVNFGFGYDESCDTYKIVVVFWDSTKRKMEIRVHYMGDSGWRNILCDPCFPLLLDLKEGQFVGGCVNWLALKYLNGPKYEWSNVTIQQLVIVSFDMCNEVYRYLSLPEGIRENLDEEPQLGFLGNHMCLFHDHNGTHIVLWKMRRYGVRESWTQLVSVSYEDLDFDGFYWDLEPIWLSQDGNILLIANRDDLVVIKYNIRIDYAKFIPFPDNEVWLWAIDYVPSLVSPCHD